MGRLGLKQVLSRVMEKKLIILAIAIICAIIGAIYSYNYVTPMYKSTSKIIISDVDYSKNTTLLNTYREIVKSRNLLENVKSNLKLDINAEELKNLVSINRVNSSDLLEITALYNNSEIAKRIAEEVVRLFADSVIGVYGSENIYMIDDANISYNPCNVNHITNIIWFTVIGSIISFITIFVYIALNNRVKKNDDIEKILKLNVLSTIPLNKKNKDEIISIKDNKTVLAEAFKKLRINIEFSNLIKKEEKTLLVTSAKGECKSYVAANLAITYAQSGKRVVLIDTDIESALQAKIFNVSNKNGLSNYIANMDAEAIELNWNLERFIKKTNINNLKLITAGNMPSNPIEFFKTQKMSELIEELKKSFDIIILDGALEVSNVFIKLAQKILLVGTYNNTKLIDLFEIKEKIENAEGKIIGICLNKLYKNEDKKWTEKLKSIPNIIINKIKNLCSNFKKSNLEKEIERTKKVEEKAEKNKVKQEAKALKEAAIEKQREETAKQKELEKEEKAKKETELAEKKAEEAKIKEAEKIVRDAERKKKIEENKEKFNKVVKKVKEKFNEFKLKLKDKTKKLAEKCSAYRNEIVQKFSSKKAEFAKKYEEYKIKRAEENKIKQEQKIIKDAEKAKIREENRIKKEERKLELAKERERIQAEIAIKKEEDRIIREAEKQKRAEEKAVEQARLEEERIIKQAQLAEEKIRQAEEKAKRDAELARKKEEERIKREDEKIRQAQEKAKREAEIAEQKARKEADNLRIREEEKERKAKEKEDAKYTDEYLEDNLYPKTKYNKF